MVPLKKIFISSKHKPRTREELWVLRPASNHSRPEHSRGMFKESWCCWPKSQLPPRKFFCLKLNIVPNEGFLLGWAPGSCVLSKSLQLHWEEVSALKITLAYIVFSFCLPGTPSVCLCISSTAKAVWPHWRQFRLVRGLWLKPNLQNKLYHKAALLSSGNAAGL